MTALTSGTILGIETEVPKMQDQTNYTELLEKEYGQDEMAVRLIERCRLDGHTDQEIYETLESFY